MKNDKPGTLAAQRDELRRKVASLEELLAHREQRIKELEKGHETLLDAAVRQDKKYMASRQTIGALKTLLRNGELLAVDDMNFQFDEGSRSWQRV